MTAKGKQNKRRERKSLKKKMLRQQWKRGIYLGKEIGNDSLSNYDQREATREIIEIDLMLKKTMRGE